MNSAVLKGDFSPASRPRLRVSRGRWILPHAATVSDVNSCRDRVLGCVRLVIGNLHRWKPETHVSHGYKRVATPDLAAEFHVWGCEFTPERIDYYFDGRLVQSLDATVIPHGPQEPGSPAWRRRSAAQSPLTTRNFPPSPSLITSVISRRPFRREQTSPDPDSRVNDQPSLGHAIAENAQRSM